MPHFDGWLRSLALAVSAHSVHVWPPLALPLAAVEQQPTTVDVDVVGGAV